MDWSLAALHVYMPDWPMTLAKIAKAATKALRPAPQVRSEIGKRQDLPPLLRCCTASAGSKLDLGSTMTLLDD